MPCPSLSTDYAARPRRQFPQIGSFTLAHLTGKQIQQLALLIIAQNPGGVTFSNLKKQIAATHPQTPLTSIQASLVVLNSNLPANVTKPIKGLFVPATTSGLSISSSPTQPALQTSLVPATQSTLTEDQFYQPFADYLVGAEEVVVAESLGGSGLGKNGERLMLGSTSLNPVIESNFHLKSCLRKSK